MNDNQERIAKFVRGFFIFLQSRNVEAAVLHGGADGFERDLSDVDFVVDRLIFQKLPALTGEYCEQSDWRLCQILLHETTAAYFVCSAADNPTCAVALDACSDYQRNGTVFLTAENLLENLQLLSWGGHALSPSTEFRYRFAKAAAKNKDADAATKEFDIYSEHAHDDCKTWLLEQWGIPINNWSPSSLGTALNQLRSRSNSCPSLFQNGSVRRIMSRILQPTGMIVVTGPNDHASIASRLQQIFGRLYFRRFRKADRWQLSMLKELVASTLIIIPRISSLGALIIPENCLHRVIPALNPEHQCRSLAEQLYRRCKHRMIP